VEVQGAPTDLMDTETLARRIQSVSKIKGQRCSLAEK
jgi:hypothetical protein